MTVKEKARELKVRFFILPEENEAVGNMTLEQAGRLAKTIALMAVDVLIKERERKPAKYWQKVKEEIIKQ